jgi:phosphatidate cytidylyltransferase
VAEASSKSPEPGPKPAAFGPQIPVASGRNLPQAVATAAVLLLLAILCYALGPDYFFWLAAAAILLALLELLTILREGGRKLVVPFALLCAFGGLLAAYWQPARPELFVLAMGAATVGSFVLALRPGRGPTPSTDAAWSLFAIAWIGGGGAAAVSILAVTEPGNLRLGLNFLVAHVLIIVLDDTAAYFVGTRFGRHKIAPSISPGKSWEGLLAGAALALAGGALFGALIGELGVLAGLALGLIDGVLAPIGDLSESAVKRELGVKDSGRLLPGHGGFLDRLDAVVFCCPAVLLFLRTAVI